MKRYKYEDFDNYTLEESLSLLEKEVDEHSIDDNGLIEDIKEELRNQDESVVKRNELIQEIVDLLNNEKEESLVCPMCDERMTHEEYMGTHIYKCEQCPFVGFYDEDGTNVEIEECMIEED